MKRHQGAAERGGDGVKVEGEATFEETKKPESEQKHKSEVSRSSNCPVSKS